MLAELKELIIKMEAEKKALELMERILNEK